MMRIFLTIKGLVLSPAATFLGAALVGASVFVLVMAILVGREAFIARQLARYAAALDRRLRSLFLFMPAKQIVIGQAVAIGMVVAMRAAVDFPFWYLIIGLIVAAPIYVLHRLVGRRREQIEEQVPALMQALANALRTTPSVGAAVSTLPPLLQKPIREEIELVIKQMRIGSSVEQALLDMGCRVGCRPLDAALSAVLIGQQLGGNLPDVLASTAATLREMARLEGVIRTKTADGKAQLFVLVLFPIILIAAFNWAQTGYFDKLSTTLIGNVLTMVAVLLWIGSIVLARKVLAVEI